MALAVDHRGRHFVDGLGRSIISNGRVYIALLVLARLPDVPADLSDTEEMAENVRTGSRLGVQGRLGRDHPRRLDGGVIRGDARLGLHRGEPRVVPLALNSPRNANRGGVHTRRRWPAAAHEGISGPKVAGQDRPTHHRMTRRVRLRDTHRPAHDSACLASGTASSMVVIMNDRSGHRRLSGRGRWGDVHTIPLLGIFALAFDTMPPTKETFVVMTGHLRGLRHNRFAGWCRGVVRPDRGGGDERQATQAHAYPCKETH